MTKKEAIKIAAEHLFRFVDSADVWEDDIYRDYVEALEVLGYGKKHGEKLRDTKSEKRKT
jgi:hypothetical protein